MVVTATGMATEVGHISGMLERRRAGEDAADEAARPADHRRSRSWREPRSSLVIVLGLVRGDELRRAVPDRDQPRDRRDPDRAARGRHEHALAGDTRARRQGRDRQAAALGRDARIDVGDLLGQDGHADAQPDDRASARRSSAGATRSTGRDTRPSDGSSASPARRDTSLEPFLLPMALANDAAVARRRDRRRPDRGGAGRSGREGRPRRRRARGGSTRGWPRCRSTPSTSSWRPSTR